MNLDSKLLKVDMLLPNEQAKFLLLYFVSDANLYFFIKVTMFNFHSVLKSEPLGSEDFILCSPVSTTHVTDKVEA